MQQLTSKELEILLKSMMRNIVEVEEELRNLKRLKTKLIEMYKEVANPRGKEDEDKMVSD